MREVSANRPVVWIVLLIAVAINVAGYVLNLFQQIWWYDDVIHGFTFFALTLWLALLLYGSVLGGAETHAVALVLTITIFGLGLGALWEIAEWAYDHLSGPQNVIMGKTETILDFIWDTIGAFVAAVWATVIARR